MKKNNCAVVLGGYLNGYCIVEELWEKCVREIIVIDSAKRFSSYSNKIKQYILIEKNREGLLRELTNLSSEYEKLIIYPTDDRELEILWSIKEEIENFCFIPVNKEKLPQQMDKYWQYKVCDEVGVPHPKTVLIEKAEDIDKIASIPFPVLIKPVKREDIDRKVFRNLQIKNKGELTERKNQLVQLLTNKIILMASEIIPGDGSNIYAYVCYRNMGGEILNEWTGKKLSQYPDDFGVFASASNQAPPIVLEQGRKLIEGLDAKGVCQPEFKYDARDGKYKLMEVNLRSMMWHRTGNLSGVNLQYTQYLDALGQKPVKQEQNREDNIHFVYLKHEIINLITRKNYYRIFYNNIFKSDKTYIAVFDLRDPVPFAVDCIDTLKMMVGTCLKTLKIR